MNLNFLKIRPIFYKIILVAILYLSFLGMFYYLSGFVYEFFGISFNSTYIGIPLVIIITLWFIKQVILFNSSKSTTYFFRHIFFLLSSLVAIHLLNYVIYGFHLRSVADFNSYKELSNVDLHLPSSIKDWNVLLISIDTLRADHLGCYGYERNTSPNIDELAAEGVLFKNHIAAAPSTLPSHASMLTSLNPSVHKAEVITQIALGSKITTLAELLKREGFITAAFTGGGQLAKEYKLDQGFDIYNDRGGSVIDILNRTLRWLDENKDQRFFLFFHTYETHHPYEPPPPYDRLFYPEYEGNLGRQIKAYILEQINDKSLEIGPDDLKHIVAQYDGEIAFTDSRLKHLFIALKDWGLWEKTLIVFTSDHGEEFNEHGIVGWHSHTLYDELLKIPLIIKFPDSAFKGVIIEQQTRGIDILPTIMDILGFQKPDMIQGVSLLPLIKNPQIKMSLPALSEREGSELNKSLRSDNYKFHYEASKEDDLTKFEKQLSEMFFYKKDTYLDSNHKEFYAIKTDPEETENLYNSHRGLATIFQKEIENLEEENRLLSSSFDTESIEPNKDLIEKLKALGYLQ